MIHNMKKLCIFLGAAALLSSCNLYKSYERPEVDTEGLYGDQVEAVIDSTSLGQVAWEDFFSDEQLRHLIARGIKQNVDLESARLNIKQARAGLMTSRLAYLPSLTFNPDGQVVSSDHGKAVQTYTVPVTATWQIDLFGNLLNQNRSAKAQWRMAKDYKQAVQSQIVAGIAKSYYTLVMLDEQLAISNESLKLMRETLTSTKALFEAGMADQAAVASTEAAYYQTATSVEDLKLALNNAETALCLVLNEKPHYIPRGTRVAQVFPEVLTLSYPVSMLSNRPDVRSAERSLQSYYYQVGVARSKFYPSITLTGQGGYTNNLGSMIANPAKLVATAIGSLTQPIFANGQLVANLRVAKAQYDQAKMDFEHKLLEAGSDVNNALTACQVARRKADMLDKQVQAAETAVHATKSTMEFGNTTYLEVISAQQTALQAKLTLVNNWYSEASGLVDLYVSLGGAAQE